MIRGRPSYRPDSANSTPTGSPAHLSSAQHYRMESAHDSATDEQPPANSEESSAKEEELSVLDETPSTPSRQSLRNITQDEENHSYHAHKSADAAEPNTMPVRGEEKSPVKLTIIIFMITMSVLLLSAVIGPPNETPAPSKVIECSLGTLKDRHPEQDECIWSRLSEGIKYLLNNRPSSPGVFLFVHQGDKRKLIKDVATITANCFGQPVGPAEMSLQDFAVEKEYRNAIYKFSELAEHNHVVIVPTLNAIPAEMAIALHTICDTHTPLVMDTVIFLSLEVPKNNVHPIENAEDELRDIWGELKQYQLEPLITRITDQVVVLN